MCREYGHTQIHALFYLWRRDLIISQGKVFELIPFLFRWNKVNLSHWKQGMIEDGDKLNLAPFHLKSLSTICNGRAIPAADGRRVTERIILVASWELKMAHKDCSSGQDDAYWWCNAIMDWAIGSYFFLFLLNRKSLLIWPRLYEDNLPEFSFLLFLALSKTQYCACFESLLFSPVLSVYRENCNNKFEY